MQIVEADDFFLPKHQMFFKAIANLRLADVPPDPVTLCTELQRIGAFEEVGGSDFVAQIYERVPEIANVGFYARTVKQMARHRTIIQRCLRISKDVWDRDFTAVCDMMVSSMQDLNRTLELAMSPGLTTKQAMQEAITSLATDEFWLMTGMEEMDKGECSMARNCLNVLGARPTMGKTSLVLNMLVFLCRLGLRVLYFSPETKCRRAMHCLASIISGRSLRELKSMRQNPANDPMFQDITQEVSSWRLETRHDPMGIDQLLHTIRGKHRFKPIDLVIVDYLQVYADNKESMDRLIRGLVDIAEHDLVTILAVSQINREVEKRITKATNRGRPQMSDLQNSGTIEQAAEVVYLLWQPSFYDHERYKIGNYDYPTEQLAEIIVAKQRTGRRNVGFPHRFIGSCYRFEPFFGVFSPPEEKTWAP